MDKKFMKDLVDVMLNAANEYVGKAIEEKLNKNEPNEAVELKSRYPEMEEVVTALSSILEEGDTIILIRKDRKGTETEEVNNSETKDAEISANGVNEFLEGFQKSLLGISKRISEILSE